MPGDMKDIDTKTRIKIPDKTLLVGILVWKNDNFKQLQFMIKT